jgi:uncharacterized protein (TIGR03067 family)
MRSIAFLSLLILSLGCNTPKKASMSSKELNGTWIPVSQEIGGKPLPAAFLEKQKLIIDNNAYTVIAESVDKGEVVYKEGGKMDINGKEGVNAGKHFTAIYKYENGQLIVCYNLAGDSYPEAFDTKGKPMFFLSVFKRG